MTPEQGKRLDETLDRFVDVVESLERAVVGEPKEGNPGLLARVRRLERRQVLYIVAVFGGTLTSRTLL